MLWRGVLGSKSLSSSRCGGHTYPATRTVLVSGKPGCHCGYQPLFSVSRRHRYVGPCSAAANARSSDSACNADTTCEDRGIGVQSVGPQYEIPLSFSDQTRVASSQRATTSRAISAGQQVSYRRDERLAFVDLLRCPIVAVCNLRELFEGDAGKVWGEQPDSFCNVLWVSSSLVVVDGMETGPQIPA